MSDLVFYVEDVDALITIGMDGTIECLPTDQDILNILWEKAQFEVSSTVTISNWILVGEL